MPTDVDATHLFCPARALLKLPSFAARSEVRQRLLQEIEDTEFSGTVGLHDLCSWFAHGTELSEATVQAGLRQEVERFRDRFFELEQDERSRQLESLSSRCVGFDSIVRQIKQLEPGLKVDVSKVKALRSPERELAFRVLKAFTLPRARRAERHQTVFSPELIRDPEQVAEAFLTLKNSCPEVAALAPRLFHNFRRAAKTRDMSQQPSAATATHMDEIFARNTHAKREARSLRRTMNFVPEPLPEETTTDQIRRYSGSLIPECTTLVTIGLASLLVLGFFSLLIGFGEQYRKQHVQAGTQAAKAYLASVDQVSLRQPIRQLQPLPDEIWRAPTPLLLKSLERYVELATQNRHTSPDSSGIQHVAQTLQERPFCCEEHQTQINEVLVELHKLLEATTNSQSLDTSLAPLPPSQD